MKTQKMLVAVDSSDFVQTQHSQSQVEDVRKSKKINFEDDQNGSD